MLSACQSDFLQLFFINMLVSYFSTFKNRFLLLVHDSLYVLDVLSTYKNKVINFYFFMYIKDFIFFVQVRLKKKKRFKII